MHSVRSTAWAAEGRSPAAPGSIPKIDLLMTRDERITHRSHGVDDDQKWPGWVRVLLYTAGMGLSWGLVWLVGTEIVSLLRHM